MNCAVDREELENINFAQKIVFECEIMGDFVYKILWKLSFKIQKIIRLQKGF